MDAHRHQPRSRHVNRVHRRRRAAAGRRRSSAHTADPPLTCTTPAGRRERHVICTAPTVPAAPAAGLLADRDDHRHRAGRHGERDRPAQRRRPSTATSPNRSPTRTPTATSRRPASSPRPRRRSRRRPRRRARTARRRSPSRPPAPLAARHGIRHPTVADQAREHKTVTPGETITWRLRVRNVGEARAGTCACATGCRPAWPWCARAVSAAEAGQLCRRVGDLRIGAERTLEITTRATRSTPRRDQQPADARADNARRARARASVGAPAPCAPVRVARAACSKPVGASPYRFERPRPHAPTFSKTGQRTSPGLLDATHATEPTLHRHHRRAYTTARAAHCATAYVEGEVEHEPRGLGAEALTAMIVRHALSLLDHPSRRASSSVISSRGPARCHAPAFRAPAPSRPRACRRRWRGGRACSRSPRRPTFRPGRIPRLSRRP